MTFKKVLFDDFDAMKLSSLDFCLLKITTFLAFVQGKQSLRYVTIL